MSRDYKAPFDPIEWLDLFMRQAEEKGQSVSVAIGAPYQDDQRDDQGHVRWVCPFACSWAADHSIPAFGVDSPSAVAAAHRSIQIMIEGYRKRLGRRFFRRNGHECGEEYGVPVAEKPPEQQQADEKRFYEVHTFILSTYWEGRSKESRQMIADLKRRREYE
jgi:hypothetical protein